MTRPAILCFALLIVAVSTAAAQMPPPIPEPPADPTPPSTPRLGPAPKDSDDPFQQVPIDQLKTSNELARASEAFATQRYAEAATLFAEADRRKQSLTTAQRDEWAYCRLHAVATQINRGVEGDAKLAELGREIENVLRSGSDKLLPFGKQLLDEVRRRGPGSATPSTAGWQSVQTASVRVLYRTKRELANEVAQVSESARRAMFERWAGPPAGDWSPRCDIYLHTTGNDYAKSTGKPADQRGHSRVEIRGGRPASRRIDVHADDPELLDATIPCEITQVVLAELFADEPLPRWALVGMAALSESPEGVARYRRAIPALLKDKKLAAVGPFLDRQGFPEPADVNAFYAQSVALVSFLVEKRGPKAFTAFLRESPRRGYAKALASHYGFKDAADLQNRWVRSSLGGE